MSMPMPLQYHQQQQNSLKQHPPFSSMSMPMKPPFFPLVEADYHRFSTHPSADHHPNAILIKPPPPVSSLLLIFRDLLPIILSFFCSLICLQFFSFLHLLSYYYYFYLMMAFLNCRLHSTLLQLLLYFTSINNSLFFNFTVILISLITKLN